MGHKYGEDLDRNAVDQKLRWSLVPTELLDEVVRVFMHGAREYGEGNWKDCDNPEDYIDAAMRHMVSLHRGEIKDFKSGFKHSAHIIASLLINDCLIREKIKQEQLKMEVQRQTINDPQSNAGLGYGLTGLGQIINRNTPFRG